MRHHHRSTRSVAGLWLRGAAGAAAALMTMGLAAEAVAQSRSADALRPQFRERFRQDGLTDAQFRQYVHFYGQDLRSIVIGDGQTIQPSVGFMVGGVPGHSAAIVVDYSLFNDTREHLCVRVKLRNRNPFNLQQTTVNDQFSFIIDPGTRHTLYIATGTYSTNALPDMTTSRMNNNTQVYVWLADMTQPPGGYKCRANEPADLPQWLSQPVTSDGYFIAPELREHLSRR